MIIIPTENSETFPLPGATFRTCASPSRGATETSTWHVTLSPGADGVPHKVTREEIFVVLSGEAEIASESERRILRAGDTLIVPAHQVFALANPGTVPFEVIAIMPVGGQAQIGDQPAFAPPWTL